MPIYEYTCDQCDAVEEILQKVGESAPDFCPACKAHNSLHKKISNSAFHLKGGGWYKDLYSSTKPADKSSDKSDKLEKKPDNKKDDKKDNKKDNK